MPKNVQIIDAALNCTYDVFEVSDDDFAEIFPLDGQDIEFSEDLFDRLEAGVAELLSARLFRLRLAKSKVHGIHGTLFYGLAHKKRFYPTKRESEMVVGL